MIDCRYVTDLVLNRVSIMYYICIQFHCDHFVNNRQMSFKFENTNNCIKIVLIMWKLFGYPFDINRLNEDFGFGWILLTQENVSKHWEKKIGKTNWLIIYYANRFIWLHVVHQPSIPTHCQPSQWVALFLSIHPIISHIVGNMYFVCVFSNITKQDNEKPKIWLQQFFFSFRLMLSPPLIQKSNCNSIMQMSELSCY